VLCPTNSDLDLPFSFFSSPFGKRAEGHNCEHIEDILLNNFVIIFQIKYICLNYLISFYKLQILHRYQSLSCANQAPTSHMLFLYSCEVLQTRPAICNSIFFGNQI